MNEIDLLEPLKIYNRELKDKHLENVNSYFEELTSKSGISLTKNKEICTRYYALEKKVKSLQDSLGKTKGKKGFLIFLLVFSIIVSLLSLLVAIVNVVYKGETLAIVLGFVFCILFATLFGFSIRWLKNANKNIKVLNENLRKESEVLNSTLSEAYASMAPLNNLYEENMASRLFAKTVPLINMDQYFDVSRYEMMIKNYGFKKDEDDSTTTLYVQSGTILGNPFLFERTYNMNMKPHVYEGSLVITYTTYRRDSKGHSYPVTHTQTLRATVTEPKPDYFIAQRLIYGNEAAPNLSFSRGPSSVSKLSEDERKKYVRKHEKDLVNLANKALGNGKSYTPLGNSEFELTFGGLNRDNEVEYRLLFTPLSQKAMLELLTTPNPYGDDFYFTKRKCINYITSNHAQTFNMFKPISYFRHFDYEKAKDNFINFNMDYLCSVFFDFAPLLSIPLYQQHKAHEYIYQGTIASNLTPFEHEALVNRFDAKKFANEKTKTDVILKTKCVSNKNGVDTVEVTAHSFDALPKISYIPVLGGDGKMHNVPVNWYQYEPLTNKSVVAMSYVGGDLAKYNELNKETSSESCVYERGLFSTLMSDNTLNVDISTLKDKMSKK